jgi:hypothetical protein
MCPPYVYIFNSKPELYLHNVLKTGTRVASGGLTFGPSLIKFWLDSSGLCSAGADMDHGLQPL